MTRFFLEPELFRNDLIPLPDEVRRHLQVLRHRSGQDLLLLDGAGTVCRATLLQCDRQQAIARIEERRVAEKPTLDLILLFGLPKGEKIELILQKGTELGVSTFLPLYTARGDRQVPADRLAGRLERWRRIVREASQQCRRAYLPQVCTPLPLRQALPEIDASLRLVPWEEESSPLRESLPSSPPGSIALLIGPEGGLEPEEVVFARSTGFVSVTLGERILRCETAGIAAVSILQYLYGDLGSSPGRRTVTGQHKS